jgi:hypothetical protein
MNPEQWARVKVLFQGALERPPSEREAWLRAAAGSDVEALREAWALLDAHDTSGEFLIEPAAVAIDDLADPGPALGTNLGPYEIVGELGRGGMGIVYLAQDARLGRRVALKVLPPVVAADPAQRERLRREARAAATISHPAVAVVYALDEIDDHVVIASEYVPGRTLRSEIDRGALPEARALAIAAAIASAIGAAHEAGVVHRDLKPENVLITDTGAVKVVDFGIAHVDGVDAARLTHTGALLGTPAYMAPEQLLGTTVDGRTDVYAAGVVLAEMVTGRHPLHGGAGTPMPPSIAGIVSRCLQPSPSARYASARELLLAIEAVAGGTAAPTRTGARWWWEFHQLVVAVVYGAMTVAAWSARTTLGGATGRTVFLLALTAAVVSAILRLHLAFTSRSYPEELPGQRRNVGRWLRAADWVFALTLVAAGMLIGDARPPLAIMLFAVGIGAVLAFLVIEPTTARAAFRTPA